MCTAPLLLSLAALAVSAAACTSPLPEQPSDAPKPTAVVSVEPVADPESLQPVSRFRVRSLGEPVPAEQLWLFRGELSAYATSRISAGDLPKTLLERRVAAVTWLEQHDTILAATEELLAGERYTLAAAGAGTLGSFGVTLDAAPVLARLWPPLGAPAGAEHAVFCGDSPLTPVRDVLYFEPGHVAASARVGAETSGELPASCVAIEPAGALPFGVALVPPLVSEGLALDPAPLYAGPVTSLSPPTCSPTELALGPGCLQVWDDRALLRGPPEPTMWSLWGDIGSELFALDAGGRHLLRRLSPSSSYDVSFEVRGMGAPAVTGMVSLHTEAALEHVVVNEVLANPLGPEPAEEWVELVNDGATSVDLAGYAFEDAAGGALLPSFVLAPGAFLLLVREDFVPDDGSDVVPAPGAALLPLPALGTNGLSNSGEKLVLRRANGSVASVFPALPKPKPGISVARREPWSLDDDPAAFGAHAPPGASPGAPNVLLSAP